MGTERTGSRTSDGTGRGGEEGVHAWMDEGETEGASSGPTEAEGGLSGKDPPIEEAGWHGGRTGS